MKNITSELPKHANLIPKEVATFMRVSLAYVYDMIAMGALPANKVARQYRIPREKFISWWEEQAAERDC